MLDAVLEYLGNGTLNDDELADLQHMTDHELQDLGISRDQIEAILDRAG